MNKRDLRLIAKKLACLVRWHDWRYATANRRRCMKCGRVEEYVEDGAGWSNGVWVKAA